MVFSMPMYREFVPKSVRPWIYVFFAIVFQLSGGIYLGTLSNMREPHPSCVRMY